MEPGTGKTLTALKLIESSKADWVLFMVPFQTKKNLKDEREHGVLPVSVIEKPIEDRMASTIRHNRARGSHDVNLMVNIVKELTESGMSDAWIMKNIGMDADELLRLKQISGLASLFQDKDYSHAWE